MDKPIMTANGNGNKLIMIGLAMTILADVFFYLFALGIREEGYIPIIGCIVIAAGIFLIVIGKKYSKTYIYVFEDYVRGQGLVNFSLGSFSLKYDKIASAFLNKDKLMINSNGVQYKIGISEHDAFRIADYITSKI